MSFRDDREICPGLLLYIISYTQWLRDFTNCVVTNLEFLIRSFVLSVVAMTV